MPASGSERFDRVWLALRQEAAALCEREPALVSYLHAAILNHSRFEDALSFHLAKKIGGKFLSPMQAREFIQESLKNDPQIVIAAQADLMAILERNPACRSYLEAFLFYKGFYALEIHRTAHWFWTHKRPAIALLMQSRISRLFAVDIHPGARIGKGVMIDHASGVVIGETAVVEDDVSILHAVTLGGTGKQTGDRHPKIRQGVLLSVGATVLGNIEIGKQSRVGAGSVVLTPVPPDCSAVGVPARVIARSDSVPPSQSMDHVGEIPGP